MSSPSWVPPEGSSEPPSVIVSPGVKGGAGDAFSAIGIKIAAQTTASIKMQADSMVTFFDTTGVSHNGKTFAIINFTAAYL